MLAVHLFDISLPVSKLLWGAGLLFFAWLITLVRLRGGWPVTELEVGLHLIADISALTWLLYHAGGSSNPFVSAYLVPIALGRTLQRKLGKKPVPR